ncbi:MAG: universal stress protein [Thermodesulfobacteriota bacterium]|nr:universal stress protein [Thermodesulfobacteriota bacterium]
MFEKILLPTDFSDVAEKALAFVKQLKDAGTKEVVVLHVIKKDRIDVIAQYGSIRDFREVEDEVEGEARKKTGRIEKELKETGFQVKVRIETGFPFSEILRVENEENVSVIVIGSHGMSNIKEILLGSVSERVIRKAKKPVLVIKR